MVIKLADRLHNMRTLNHLAEEKRIVIAQETRDIYAPIAGKISKVNNEVSKNPALVNQAPYGNGWLFTIEKAAGSTDAHLMAHAAYQTSLSEEH